MRTVVTTAKTIQVLRADFLHPSYPHPKKRTAAVVANTYVTVIMLWVSGVDMA